MQFFRRHITILFCFPILCLGQENMGIANSNYAPTNTVLINPSSIVDSWTFLDINIIGAGLYVRNNSAFISKEDFYFPSFIRDNSSATIDEPGFNEIDTKKFAYLDVFAHGPSATMSLGRFSVGVTTQLRHFTDVRNMPEPFVKFMREGFQYSPQHNIDYQFKNIRTNAQTFAEIGITGAGIIQQRGNNMWSGGITIKRLFGIQSTHLNVNDISLNVLDSSDAYFGNLDATFGHSVMNFNAGRGWGVDLGVTFTKYEQNVGWYKPHSTFSNCEKKQYRYKIGLSLLDFGRIKYRGVFDGSLSREDYTWQEYDTVNINGVWDATGRVITRFSDEVRREETYNVFLPTALSFQIDYNLDNYFYIGINGVQSSKLFRRTFGVRRGNTLAIVPRYERKYFEASLPITLHDYKYPQIGLMLRLNNLIIGSDHVTPFLFRSNIYGADIYFNLKIPIYKSRKCKDKSTKKRLGSRNKKKRNKRNDCAGYKL